MKSCRIVRISGIAYKGGIETVLHHVPEFQNLSFQEQQRQTFKFAINHSDSFARTMRQLGYEAHELLFDFEIMQKTWAREHQVQLTNDSEQWRYEILLKQIETLRPDILYLQNVRSMPYELRADLKNRFPFLKLVIIFKGSAHITDRLADADILFACTPTMVEHYQHKGLNPHLLYHSFDPAILENLEQPKTSSELGPLDFTFFGSSGFGHGPRHHSRYWTLVELLERTRLEAWTADYLQAKPRIAPSLHLKVATRRGLKQAFSKLPAQLLEKVSRANTSTQNAPDGKLQRIFHELAQEKAERAQWAFGSALDQPRRSEKRYDSKPAPNISLLEKFPQRCHPPVFGMEMYHLLSQSRVTFNRHIDEVGESVGNMRLFEASGVGACLLTDTGKNIRDLFDPEHEVVTYESVEECIEKLTFLLEHESERRKIATAGQKRTLQAHTVFQRCQQIDALIQERLG